MWDNSRAHHTVLHKRRFPSSMHRSLVEASIAGVVDDYSRSETGRASVAASSDSPWTWNHPRLHRQQTLALQLFAGELAGATDGFRLFPDSLL